MMSVEDIRLEAKKFFPAEDDAHDWDHTERVLKLAMKIGAEEGADLDILAKAVLLHDIARKDETAAKGKICHAKLGAERASQILVQTGHDATAVREIIHCIEAHRAKDVMPSTTEAKVLYDADKIDTLGAVGIGRLFQFAGEIGSRLHINDADLDRGKDYTPEDTAYRYFLIRTSKLKDNMFTEAGQRMAAKRHEAMVEFFDRLNKEVDGEL